MEPRARKHPPGRSERPRPWPEPAQIHHQQERKIPVVYYLSRNRHLEHPHFIEVPLSSPDGLYLRDVINRLYVLRGKGMPARYSWSCKRSYKSGYVWHDLSEDDLILPANGSEYVLKGSELLDQSPPDRSILNPKLQPQSLPEQETPISSRIQNASSSSSPSNIDIKEAKTLPSSLPQLKEASHSPSAHYSVSSGESSRELARPRLYDTTSPGPAEYRVYKTHEAADASTQTDDGARLRRPRGLRETCIRGISTDSACSPDLVSEDRPRWSEISPPATSSSTSSSAGKTETLDSLIRAEASRMNSFRILEEEEVIVPAAVTKLKATDVLIQLITCGVSTKNHHSFGLIPTYLPRFSRVRFPSPVFSSSMMPREIDCLSDNSKLMRLRLEDKAYFSGSVIETKNQEELEEVVPTLKRSSSYNAHRLTCKSPDSIREEEKVEDSSRSNWLPRSTKTTSNNQPRNGTIRSPISDCSLSSNSEGKRITDASAVKASSMRIVSSKEEKGRMIRIEERLTSGARVIIQSRAPCDDSDDSSSP